MSAGEEPWPEGRRSKACCNSWRAGPNSEPVRIAAHTTTLKALQIVLDEVTTNDFRTKVKEYSTPKNKEDRQTVLRIHRVKGWIDRETCPKIHKTGSPEGFPATIDRCLRTEITPSHQLEPA